MARTWTSPRDPELAVDLFAIRQADEAGTRRPTKDLKGLSQDRQRDAVHKKRAALGRYPEYLLKAHFGACWGSRWILQKNRTNKCKNRTT